MRTRPWLAFGGAVLTVAVLDWAQPVLMPVAFALVITFVLHPPVMALQRWIGRVPAAAGVVSVVLAGLLLLTWLLTQQVASLAVVLPEYRQNIRQKIADVRGVSESRALTRAQEAIDDLRREFNRPADRRGVTETPRVITEPAPDWLGLPPWIGPAVGTAGTIGLVTLLVLFMLIEYRDLRARMLALAGHGNVASTTKAFDEAASRLSRYLLMQSVTNVTYGVLVGVGLSIIGVPYPLLWASLGAALRYVPYVGPWFAAGLPTFVSLAVSPGWRQTMVTAGFFVALEAFTNLVLETVLYAGAAGVSQVALIVALTFWTWIWGPIGLLLATPLTVCLVVLGKHAPGLRWISTLIGDAPALSVDAAFYQRVLAGDQGDASDLVDEYLKTQPVEGVYDALLLPALCYAERDRGQGRITEGDERSVLESTRDLLDDLPNRAAAAPRREGLPILGVPMGGEADALALQMVERLLIDQPVTFEVASTRTLMAELVGTIRSRRFRAICLADLPPGSSSRARYAVKRLRREFPDLTIVVGRWAPAGLAEDPDQPLLDAGASLVTHRLIEARDALRDLAAALATSAA